VLRRAKKKGISQSLASREAPISLGKREKKKELCSYSGDGKGKKEGSGHNKRAKARNPSSKKEFLS